MIFTLEMAPPIPPDPKSVLSRILSGFPKENARILLSKTQLITIFSYLQKHYRYHGRLEMVFCCVFRIPFFLCGTHVGEIIEETRENLGRMRIWSLEGLGVIFTVNLIKRLAQKLRIIILLHLA